ncbi:telomere binding protein [Mortierella claussenii]|nr:telomere binding protein [Mortierella claussenii]
MAGTQDAEAMSAYLTDLQNPIRAPGARLAAVTRVLSEPLSFLGMEYLRGHGHGHAPASANTHAQAMAPNWAGPLAPTTARRSYFIQHLLPSHLEFLLDNVTINWLSALPSTQQTYLFDGSFVPTASLGSGQEKMGQEDQEQTEARCMMAVVSLQTLVSKVQGRQFQENHSFLNSTVLRLLKKLIVTYSMKEFYAGCLTMAAGKSSPNADTGVGGYSRVRDDTLWDSFLSRLFSIPTRVSNALGGNAPTRVDVEECFREEEFFRKQTVQLQMCLGNLGAKHDGDVDTEQEAKAFGIVVTKFLRLGYGRTLIESVVSTLWGREPTDDDPKAKGWKLALTRVSSTGTVQLFLTTLVDYLNGHQLNFRSSGGGRKIGTNTTNTTIDSKCTTSQEEQVSAVHRGANLLVSIGFGTQEVNNILKSSKSNSDQGESNNALVDEVLFQGRIFGIGVLRMLVCIQSGWPTGVRSDKDSALARSFKKALEIWSDTMLVSHASTEYQRSNSQIAEISFKSALDVSYQVLLMVGYFNVQVLIEADLIPIFSVGVSSWLEMESFQRKQIGLIVAEEFSRAVDTIGAPADFDLDSSDPEIQFSRSLVQLKDGSQPYTPTREPSRSSSDGTENIRTEEAAVQEESDDEYDPDELEDGFTRASTYKGESSGEEDEDEKDGLKPYAMEYESDPDEDVGSVKKAKVAAPLYLRDLVSYLRAGEDRDKIEIGLRSAAELIRRKAGSLELGTVLLGPSARCN